ncbi:hypothetical protein [Mycolicibacterium sarraceniae]|uniref:hypothetical protein n=1 Tax=Mycolicibacterium sarraceniae TaxID=1534348 RepID=UPI0013D446E0|nr:hypothetical protein [Mycolicibacterium sarraceniae]
MNSTDSRTECRPALPGSESALPKSLPSSGVISGGLAYRYSPVAVTGLGVGVAVARTALEAFPGNGSVLDRVSARFWRPSLRRCWWRVDCAASAGISR